MRDEQPRRPAWILVRAINTDSSSPRVEQQPTDCSGAQAARRGERSAPSARNRGHAERRPQHPTKSRGEADDGGGHGWDAGRTGAARHGYTIPARCGVRAERQAAEAAQAELDATPEAPVEPSADEPTGDTTDSE